MFLEKFKTELRAILLAPISWLIHFYRSIVGPTGYLVIASLIGVYITFYTIVSAKHDRDSNRNATELSNYYSMLSSGDRLGMISFIDDYARIYNYRVIAEPSFFEPSAWYDYEYPNRNILRKIAQVTFDHCMPMKCSDTPKIRIDASYSYLSLVRFRAVDFSRSNFVGSDLRDSSLRRNNFSFSDFSNVRANNVDFSGSNMKGANFSGAILQGARLKTSGYGENSGVTKIVLSSVDFSGANLKDTDFTGADLVGSLFGNLEKSGKSRLKTTTVQGAKFIGANLSGASFINTDLRGADFTRANLNEVYFDNIKFDESTIFPEEFDHNRLN